MSERPVWKTHEVLTLFVALLTSVFVAALAGQLLSRYAFGYAPKSPEELFLLQISGALMGFQLSGFLLCNAFLGWHGVGWRQGFGIGKPVRSLGIAVIACGLFLPLAWGLQTVIQELMTRASVKPELQETVLVIQQASTPRWQQAIVVVMAVITAPLVEELLFRGVLFRWLEDRGRRRLALWGTALAFGLVHFNALAFVPLTLFGALLAWLYRRTGNLLVSILTHSLFNLSNVLAIVYGKEITDWLKHLWS